MTEADILALTYQDSCWVYRPQKTTLPLSLIHIFHLHPQGGRLGADGPR